jgi:AraC-like DNA-binding protein
VILGEHYEMLERLTRCRTWKEIRRGMHEYVQSLLDHVRPSHHTNMELLVAEIRQHMRNSLDRPRSLAQYADAARISVGHLSRSFGAIAGRSFRGELQHLRMEAARELLMGSTMKIGVISRRVGLSDPSQFIAQFRRETGMTPGTYRKHAHSPPARASPAARMSARKGSSGNGVRSWGTHEEH